jgi:DNA modification methylase
MTNFLYYGDNLDVLRKKVSTNSIDLCYIDPPFNSKRNYNQIYDNIGQQDKAQAQAFVDTWTWDDYANFGLNEIMSNTNGLFTRECIELIRGFTKVLGKGSLLAYLVSMSLRIVEIHRVLKSTGTFFLHCDPTASHYLKLILDAIFVPQGGRFLNEIVWCYGSGGASKRYFSKKHDVIFFYSKSEVYTFNVDNVREAYSSPHKSMTDKVVGDKKYVKMNPLGRIPFDWWQIPILTNSAKERLGYPTQKPESLLEKVIDAASNEGDVILDAYCGCGTSVAVAQRLRRTWIGIDITYQSISLILRRLEDTFGKSVLETINLSGVPRDINAARALANKKDDRTRKEFEKWAVLTFSNNRAIINDKKGADHGIDGIAYVQESADDYRPIILSVKSGQNIGVAMVRDLRGVMEREQAAAGVLITLEPPTRPMTQEAKGAGTYQNPFMSSPSDRIQIVSIEQILSGERLRLPLTLEVLKRAEAQSSAENLPLGFQE